MVDNTYARATPELLASKDITDGDKVVYLAILAHADHRTLANAYPSMKTIAAESGKCVDVVKVSIARLEAKGWLTHVKRRTASGDPDSNLYAFPRQPLPDGVGGNLPPTGRGQNTPTTRSNTTSAQNIDRISKRAARQAVQHLAVVQHIANGGTVPEPVDPDDRWDF